ncbi:MAG: hypothetical protein LBC82_03630 [Oscillospiraceae bacterium]|nr:hypothetical protein [Oscillospiraceae bacterium]
MDISAQLFEFALGIEKPVFIEKIEFDKQDGELHIHMNFERGGKFTCPACGKVECSVHDTTEKTWRQEMSFLQRPARTPKQ